MLNDDETTEQPETETADEGQETATDEGVIDSEEDNTPADTETDEGTEETAEAEGTGETDEADTGDETEDDEDGVPSFASDAEEDPEGKKPAGEDYNVEKVRKYAQRLERKLAEFEKREQEQTVNEALPPMPKETDDKYVNAENGSELFEQDMVTWVNQREAKRKQVSSQKEAERKAEEVSQRRVDAFMRKIDEVGGDGTDPKALARMKAVEDDSNFVTEQLDDALNGVLINERVLKDPIPMIRALANDTRTLKRLIDQSAGDPALFAINLKELEGKLRTSGSRGSPTRKAKQPSPKGSTTQSKLKPIDREIEKLKKAPSGSADALKAALIKKRKMESKKAA